MSTPTASAMIAPSVMFCHADGTACRLSPFWTITIVNAPNRVAKTLPWPPNRLAPPITADAIAISSIPWP
jgi:hypothetical protein